MSAAVRVSDEVAQALNEGKPVVALESTIISHGMFVLALPRALARRCVFNVLHKLLLVAC